MPDKKLLIICLTALLLTGCSPAPSMVVFGASFPDWLFCLCGGVAGMVAIHLLLRIPEKRAWLAPQLLTYPALTALIAMLTWLLVFPH
ncbi:YtcA family lipoprotein [Serratia marcescens]|uniref:YtcA family lipoprotein n=1 Tax=Serratia marcescens TaxID=615 RepID=UPI002468F133|nr:YtcA family lipoprotein [Serratia marcescens]WGL92265.1 YtcA family lipoprotein [Serratia marcescens]